MAGVISSQVGQQSIKKQGEKNKKRGEKEGGKVGGKERKAWRADDG